MAFCFPLTPHTAARAATGRVQPKRQTEVTLAWPPAWSARAAPLHGRSAAKGAPATPAPPVPAKNVLPHVPAGPPPALPPSAPPPPPPGLPPAHPPRRAPKEWPGKLYEPGHKRPWADVSDKQKGRTSASRAWGPLCGPRQ